MMNMFIFLIKKTKRRGEWKERPIAGGPQWSLLDLGPSTIGQSGLILVKPCTNCPVKIQSDVACIFQREVGPFFFFFFKPE